MEGKREQGKNVAVALEAKNEKVFGKGRVCAMKNRWIANAFDGVSDEYISDAYKGKKKTSGFARVLGAAAACICIVLGTVFSAYAFSEDVRSYINLRFFKMTRLADILNGIGVAIFVTAKTFGKSY